MIIDVETALEIADSCKTDAVAASEKTRGRASIYSPIEQACYVLGAEVKRMRDAPIYARMARVNGQLRATLVRVEDVVAKWSGTKSVGLLLSDIEAALRGAA